MNEGNDAPYAERAARLLRAGRATVGPRSDVRPEPVIAALADAIRGSARRRKVRAWVIGGAVAVVSGLTSRTTTRREEKCSVSLAIARTAS